MEVAAVMDGRAIRQLLSGMHMSQRPVVEARATQVVEGRRRVGLVDGASAGGSHLRVQERHLREGCIGVRPEATGQVVGFVGSSVSHTRNVANRFSRSPSDLYQDRVPRPDDCNRVGPILGSCG